MEDQNFRFIMDTNEDDEATYQYFAIKNDDDENNITINDIFGLPNDNDELDNNKQIFYLTFDQTNDGEGDEQQEEEVLKEDELSLPKPELETNTFDGGNDVKLITLEDGRMFMATNNGENLEQITTPVLLDTEKSLNADDSESNDTVLNKVLIQDFDANYLVQLSDGTQAVLKICKTENKTVTEEVPKKKKKYQCFYEGCTKVYATSYHLTVHMRTHTDSKPYECTMDGCEKKFSTNYSLKAHIRTHTGETPFACTNCTKQFKASGDLLKHTRIHTGEKPFLCPIEGCGKSFTTSNCRKVHIRSHTGERPYSCDYPNCGKAFTSLTNYKNHLRIHSGEKPYVCNVPGCNKRFTEYSSLYKHNLVHQPDKPFQCDFCDQRFKKESALNHHKRFIHNVVFGKDGTEIIVKIE